MKEVNDLDKLFKKGLENPEVTFDEQDWQSLEQRLHPKKKGRIVPFFWIAVAGIAAMLFVVFLLIQPVENKTEDLAKSNIQRQQVAPKLNNGTSKHEDRQQQDSPMSIPYSTSVSTDQSHFATTESKPENTSGFDHSYSTSIALQRQLNASLSTAKIEPEPGWPKMALQQIRTEMRPDLKNADTKVKINNKKPNFTLGIVAAPDLTSVQRSGKSSFSGGIGIEATLMLTKRLSITTGASYAKKIYDSDFSLYNPRSSYVFKNQPANIHANCDVLDIPLNLNYRLFGNQRNSLTLSTGLSSYLMLREAYYYSYNNAYAAGPQSYEVKNQNQHLLGIANVGVAFQHQISNTLSIKVTPFVKVPLTNIGYGNSKLSSTGIAVSINMTDLFNQKQGPSIPRK